MKNIIIADNNKYSFENLTCYEKPVGIVLSSFDFIYQELFYAYVKTVQAYLTLGFEQEELVITDFENAIRYVLEDKLGFELKTNYCDVNNIHELIINSIDEETPVTVTVNLKELHYSQYYQKEEWPYLLLITGYDKTRKIYHILDTTHTEFEKAEEGKYYKSFSITFEMLEQMYSSYQKYMDNSFVIRISSKSGNTTSKEGLVKDFINFFLNRLSENPFKEIQFVNQILDNIKGKPIKNKNQKFEALNDINFVFTRSIKYKELIYNILGDVVSGANINKNLSEKHNELAKNIISCWKKVQSMSLVALQLKREINPEKQIVNAINAEQEYKLFLDDVFLRSNFTLTESLSFEEPKEEKMAPTILQKKDRVQKSLDEREIKILEICKEILNKKDININDNYFEIGGNSLSAIKIIAEINSFFEIDLTLDCVLSNPVFSDFISFITKETKNKKESVDKIKPIAKKEYYGLSSAQLRMWHLCQNKDASIAYNNSANFNIDGTLDISKFKKSLVQVLQKHDALRVSFKVFDGIPKQRIPEEIDIDKVFEFVDIENQENKQEVLTQIIDESAHFYFDLHSNPLFNIKLIKYDRSTYALSINLHHIISDGFSILVFIDALSSAYEDKSLSNSKIGYVDYADWHNRYVNSDQILSQKQYWEKQFSSFNPFYLPTDFTRTDKKSYTGKSIYASFTESETEIIRGFCKNQSLFNFLFTSYFVLLNKISGSKEVYSGIPFAGRNKKEVNSLIGLFVNTIVINTAITDQLSFKDLSEQVKNTVNNAFKNQELPFEQLIDITGVENDASRNPVFENMFILQDIPGTVSIGNAVINPRIEYTRKTSMFDLFFEFFDVSPMKFRIEYCSDLFKEETIHQFISYYKRIIQQILEFPEIKISEIDIISNQEKTEIVETHNKTQKPYNENILLNELFENKVLSNPNKIAIHYSGDEITYNTLNQSSNQLAHLFIKKGVQLQDKIAVFCERSPGMIQSMLAILKAGGCYVPIDSNWPKERVQTILDTYKINQIVTQSKLINVLVDNLYITAENINVYVLDNDFEKPFPEELPKKETIDLWDNIIESSVDKITAGGFKSSYTGLPFTTNEVQEYKNRIAKLLSGYIEKDNSQILEIGCGSGTILFDIVSSAQFVTGIDPSLKSIEYCQNKRVKLNIKNLDLIQGFAHEIESIVKNRKFDIVIISNTIQFFPGIFYLQDVIQKCFNLLSDNGIVLISDVLNLRTKQVFKKSLLDFKNANTDKKFQTKLNLEEELYLDENYFKQIAFENDVNCHLYHRDSGFDNELKYRFDVVLEKGVKPILTSSPFVNFYTNWHILNMPTESLNLDYCSDNLAYIISTSGSTGNPNGVAVSHKPVINLIEWVNNTFNVNPEDKLLFTTSICFDLSVYDIFGMLASGGTIRIASEEELKQPEKLVDYLCNDEITFWDSAPAAMQQLVDYFPEKELSKNSKLRLVFLSGDWIPVALPDQIKDSFEKTEVISLGGATEATVWSNYYPTGKVEKNWPSIPYGKPIQNAKYYILDERLRVCPFNVPGDLYIGGECLAQGYANNEELTKERFIKNPFSDDPNERMYKTGDLAKWLPDGNMIFLGRKDNQVKIRGYRIELGDIEAKLSNYLGISWSKVLTKQNNHDDKVLCAFYKADIIIEEALIKESLESQLPSYMVPQVYKQIEEIPKTVNGKVDYKKLIRDLNFSSKEIINPDSELEIKLSAIWSDILDIDQEKISLNDSFFSLGGHSLKVMKLSHLIYKEFQVEVKQSLIFSNPVLMDLAQIIDEQLKKQEVNADNIDEIIL